MMGKYKIKIDPLAMADINEISNWYNEQQVGLGDRFVSSTIQKIETIGAKPDVYAIRYEEIRCAIVDKFPYMIHFYVDRNSITVEILAVISSSRNPKVWEEKTRKD